MLRIHDRRSRFGGRLAVMAAMMVVLTTCTDDAREPIAPDVPLFDATLNDEYNLVNNQTLDVNGATWKQAQNFQVGTGVLQPFLQVQDNDGNEEGFNTNFRPAPLDMGNAADHNHALALNHVPVVRIGTSLFREFILDANEANNVPAANFSIDKFDLWLCNDGGAENFDAITDFEGSGSCALVYDLDDGPGGDGQDDRILATDANSRGSGSAFDYQILIPDGKFQTAAAAVGANTALCSYAGGSAPSCGVWLILNVKLGFKGGDHVVGSTFEEFSTLQRPFVAVTKTATPTFTRTYGWLLEKAVNPAVITLFDGQSQNATWTITVTPTTPAFVDGAAQVNGTITIANTSGAAVTITSVTDVIAGYPAITPSCPGSFPQSLANGATLVCTYTVTPPDTDPGSHTNTATVEIFAKLDPDDAVDAAVFSASANFNFATVTPTEIDKNPPVFDNYNGAGEQGIGNASGSPFVTVRPYNCNADAGTYSNTARVDLTAVADLTASATLTVNCLDLTVTKTADEAITRTYLWSISKGVTPESWELFRGDQGTSHYTVTVTPNGSAVSAHSVSGVITITNPNTLPVFLQSLSDAIGGTGGPFTPTPFDCEDNGSDIAGGLTFPYTLVAGHVITCDYTQALPDDETRTNTATVAAKPTADGTSKDFSGTAAVDFTGAVETPVNQSVHVDDSFADGPQDALVTDLVDPTSFEYDRNFTCDDDGGTHDNTATITETSQSDDALVTVTCRRVVVQKNATTSFDRDFDWTIDKSANQTALLLSPGQTFNVDYSIAVTKSDAQDANHHVTGTIRIAHTHTTRGAVLNSLTDVVSGVVGNATLSDCNVDGTPFSFPGTLDVGAQLRCTYDLDLPDAVARTNTATLVQQNHDYDAAGGETPAGTTNWATGAVAVSFGDPTHVTDDCVVVDDDYAGGPQAQQACASTVFGYTRSITAPGGVCTDFTVLNTATLTSDDGIQESDNWSVAVDVACPTGCTLTLGYWKTHNESFTGGAPLDDTWDLLPAAEGSGFFTSAPSTLISYPIPGPNTNNAFTWFNVFWTAPQGNAYYNLAHQYMAAKLNILNGADPTAVNAAIGTAEGLFATTTPTAVALLRGNQKALWITTAGTLGQYNEGLIGPGHCSEDGTSGQSLVASAHTAIQ